MVGGPLRGERLQIRQPQQPQVAHLLGAEAEAVGLQEVEAEDGVVDVVVPAAAVDAAAHARAPLGPRLEAVVLADGPGKVVGQGKAAARRR
jgi:hypothetical protein